MGYSLEGGSTVLRTTVNKSNTYVGNTPGGYSTALTNKPPSSYKVLSSDIICVHCTLLL